MYPPQLIGRIAAVSCKSANTSRDRRTGKRIATFSREQSLNTATYTSLDINKLQAQFRIRVTLILFRLDCSV